MRFAWTRTVCLASLLITIAGGCKKDEEKKPAPPPAAPTTPANPGTSSTSPASAPTTAGTSGTSSKAPSAVSSAALASIPTTPADFKVTANALSAEFAKDATAASAKYKGKSVRVEGSVDSVNEFNMDNQYMFQLAGNPKILCIAAVGGRKGCKALSLNQEATVRGNFEAWKDDKITLSDVWVWMAGEDNTRQFTAVEMTTALAAQDRIGRFQNPLHVTGTVASVAPDGLWVILEGGKDPAGKPVNLKCMVGMPGSSDAKKLKKGDQVVINGVGSSSVDPDDDGQLLAKLSYAVIQN